MELQLRLFGCTGPVILFLSIGVHVLAINSINYCPTKDHGSTYLWSSTWYCTIDAQKGIHSERYESSDCLPNEILLTMIGNCENDTRDEQSYDNITAYLVVYPNKTLIRQIASDTLRNVRLNESSNYECCEACAGQTKCGYKGQLPPEIQKVFNDRMDWVWQSLGDNYVYRLDPPWKISTTSIVTNDTNALVTQPTDLSTDEVDSSSVISISRSNSEDMDATKSEYDNQALGLGLGLGLGLALLISIIINIVFCIKIKGDKSQKRSVLDPYASIVSNGGSVTANNMPDEPEISAGYSSISPDSPINRNTYNRETLYAPTSPYDYASTGNVSNNNGSIGQKNTAPSVFYAIVNKVKSNKNESKRNLGNPNEDTIIVDNDLYTSDIGGG